MPLEAEFADGTLQFARSVLWVGGGHGRKTLEAAGMTGARIRDQVVDAVGCLHRRAGFEVVKTRCG